MFPSLLGFPRGSGTVEEAELTLLADGVYWQDGDATAKLPIEGQGWLSTANLTDGLVGDTSTRINSTGTTLTVIHVHAASPYVIGEWAIASKWIDGQTEAFWELDLPNSTWDTVTIDSGLPSDHVAYTDETWTAVLTALLTSAAHMVRLVTDGASVMSMSDSRPAA